MKRLQFCLGCKAVDGVCMAGALPGPLASRPTALGILGLITLPHLSCPQCSNKLTSLTSLTRRWQHTSHTTRMLGWVQKTIGCTGHSAVGVQSRLHGNLANQLFRSLLSGVAVVGRGADNVTASVRAHGRRTVASTAPPSS